MADDCTPIDFTRVAPVTEYERPAADSRQSRSVVVARHGMVATSQPLAAEVGLDILKAGGTAADAAIAANAMLGVVEPMSCGIGGDLFVMYWDAGTQQLSGLNGSGRSPFALNREVFHRQGLRQIPDAGPLSWSVPGCVDGWEELRKRFGTMSLAKLLEPAIRCAEEGFAVSEIIANSWQASVGALRRDPDSAATFLPEGRAPGPGEVSRNPRLAATCREIAEQGPEAFYTGRIAREIVAFSEARGGFFSLKDFAEHRSDWIEPVSTRYRGCDVWQLPPGGQGIAALQMLNVLEAFDIRAMGRQSADYLHLFVEAKKLAFADRARYYADPDFEQLPVRQLISREYASRQIRRIDMSTAATDVPAGHPQLAHGDTVYVTVVDRNRNCCSLIQSIYYSFGSKVVAGGLGFALQNRGALFALDETHHNRLEPHKRPFHTIIPAMVTRDQKPWFCFGVMGGDMQPQGHVQVLANLIDFDLNVQAAGDAARVRHGGSPTPTGLPPEPHGGHVAVEAGIPPETLRELQRRGHRLVHSPGSFGGYQGILIDWPQGTLHGGTDPRKDGAAVGY